MRTSTVPIGLLLLASLAVADTGRAQTTPPYRPATNPATSSQSASSSSATASAQCSSAAAPAGATVVSRGNGTAPAPKNGAPSYSQTTLNLANYSVGGQLTIQITAGSGSSPATFELFPAGTTFSSNGTPSTQPLASATSVAPGSCATLNFNFSQAGSYILVATGASGSNTFQYAANVEPSFTGVFSATPATSPAGTQSTQPSQAASQAAQPNSPTQPTQGPGLFTGVFTPAPANQPTQAAAPVQPSIQPVQPVQSANGQPATPSPASPAPNTAQTQASAAPALPAPAQPSSPIPSPANPAPNTPAPVSPAPAQPGSPTPPQPASPSSASTPLMIQSVTIQNSPGVPDTGGHSILGGLLRGSLTAVEPNLVLCVTPTGDTQEARSCTGICNPGHDCNAPLQRGVTLGSTPSVHVEVLDNDKQGKTTPLAAFDQSDATQCTTAQPCTQTVPDPTSSDPNGTELSISFGFATPEGCNSSAGIWSQGPVLLASTRMLPGVLPLQAFRKGVGCTVSATPPACDGPYQSIEDAMARSLNGPTALHNTEADLKQGFATENGYMIVRDPQYSKVAAASGGYYATPPVRSTMQNKDGTYLITWDDYLRSMGECAQGLTFTRVATVHTHPKAASFEWTFPNFAQLRLYNWNFTPPDFTQSVQLKTGLDSTDKTVCVPNDPSKVTAFEEIVMIYAEDYMVRTFKPTPGVCTFSPEQNKNMLTTAATNSDYSNYADWTCILPWEYASGGAGPGGAITVPRPDKNIQYYECKGNEASRASGSSVPAGTSP